VITNSSSEIFMVVDKNTIEEVKELAGNILKSLGNNENIDDVISIDPYIDEDTKLQIKYMILTGMFSRDIWNKDSYDEAMQRIKDGEQDDDEYSVSGYPVCNDESEITPEIFEKAMYDFSLECTDMYDYAPAVSDMVVSAKKPEYEQFAKNINELIHCVEHAIYGG